MISLKKLVQKVIAGFGGNTFAKPAGMDGIQITTEYRLSENSNVNDTLRKMKSMRLAPVMIRNK